MPDDTTKVEPSVQYSVEADKVYVDLDFGVTLRRAAIKSITFPKELFREAYEADDEFIKIKFPQGFLYTDPPHPEICEDSVVGEEATKEGLN